LNSDLVGWASLPALLSQTALVARSTHRISAVLHSLENCCNLWGFPFNQGTVSKNEFVF